MKETANAMIKSLQKVFEKSIDEGISPDDWKLANTTPIFKRGDKKQQQKTTKKKKKKKKQNIIVRLV